ncbi:VC0807 family protein [Streptomyces sp. NPDC023723]|uniref:VC0807 family protein n=1 Tax=Streptomyces sp. NPDC023723 TaxID=3154323 RepID=UPI0034007FB8
MRTHADTRRTLVSLVLDVGAPIGSYYLLKDGVGVSTLAALGWSGVLPVLRAGWGLAGRGAVNGLALLILLANGVGLVVGVEAGEPRLMLARDSVITSVVGFVLLGSVVVGRPMMSGMVRPWVVKGDAARERAWGRLRGESVDFRRAERWFTGMWGVAFAGESAVRVVGAYTLPVDVMVWLGTVVMCGVIGVTFVVSGAVAARPMLEMVERAVRRAEGDDDSSLAGSTQA